MMPPLIIRWAMLCPVVFGIPWAAIAQESPDSSSDLSPPPSVVNSGTYIPDDLIVTPFTPPPPKPPATPLLDAKETIIVNDTAGHTVTLQRGPASLAPDIPSHKKQVAEKPSSDFSQFPARPAITTLQFGGVVYDRHISVVHWKHPSTDEEYSAVLGYDINLLGQVGKFVRQGKRVVS